MIDSRPIPWIRKNGLWCAIWLFWVAGCNAPPAISPEAQATYRKTFLLQESPKKALSILEARGEPASAGGITIEGIVGGISNPWKETHPHYPWTPGEASFFLVDTATSAKLGAHNHGSGKDHADCPFCARAAAKNIDSVAVVHFLDEQGNVLKIDARELFDLQRGDKVVVRGRAKLLGESLLVIEAEGVYVASGE